MKNNNIKELKKKYEDVDIPDNLNDVVVNTIKKSKRKNYFKKPAILSASFVLIFILIVNFNQVFAKSMKNVPILNNIVRLITFKEYSIKNDSKEVDINIFLAKFDGLSNKQLEQQLNNKYVLENKKIYQSFIKEVIAAKDKEKINKSLDVTYSIENTGENIYLIKNSIIEMAGSSQQIINYDTIDSKNQILITLPSLFKNSNYINIISKEIKRQMSEQMKNDKDKVYFIEDFKEIGKNQKFYISNNKLYISFDSYTIAPGYMGNIIFEIPTKVIENELVSDYYIK